MPTNNYIDIMEKNNMENHIEKAEEIIYAKEQ